MGVREQLIQRVYDRAEQINEERTRKLRAFHAAQRGREIAEIQADYYADFGGTLSDERAQLYSDGAPLTITTSITPPR